MSERLSAAALIDLGEKIAEQAVHLDAAMHRLLSDLRRFDEAGGWHRQGFSSCAHWLSHRVGWDLGTARERCRVARALAGLPKVEAALASGTLSYSKARAITRVAKPATEPTLLAYAETSTASQLETICRKVHAVERRERDAREPLPSEDERYVITQPTSSGMICVKAFLRPEEAALLMQVIQQAAKDCTRAAQNDGDGNGGNGDAATMGHGGAPDRSGASAETLAGGSASLIPPLLQRRSSFNRADGLMTLVQTYARGSSPDRSPIEMIVTTPAETLRAEVPSPTPTPAVSATAAASQAAESDSMLAACACAPHDRGASIPVAVVAETNTYLPPETARRLACDCGLVEATVDAHGEPLSVGRKTRTIPASIKRALLLRDRTCRFPGCDHRLFLDGHHLRHWADGGETKISNLTLLCSTHHHYIHERGYRVLQDEADASILHFLDPRGKPVVAVPPRPSPPDLGWTAIRAANAHLPLSAETSILVGHGGSLDLKDAVGRVLRAEERAQEASPDAKALPCRPAPSYPWRSKGIPPFPPMSPVQHAVEERRPRDEDSADPDYDFVYAGRRGDDLLEWAMEEMAATGIDPLATVPAPYAPPVGWRSKVRD